MKCHFCGEEWPLEKVSFSAVCEGCGRWLHSCVQCRLWNRNTHRCLSMTTEPVPDREGKNFCEEWQPGNAENAAGPAGNSSDFDALFGD